MKKRLLLFLLFTSLTAFLRAETLSGTHPYLHASVAYADFGPHFKSSGGFAYGAGLSFKRKHAIEIERFTVNTENKDKGSSYLSEDDSYGYRYLFATYRYTFNISKRFNLSAAGSGGYLIIREDRKYYFNGSLYNHVRSKTDTLVGAIQVGGAYNFTPHSALTASIRLLSRGPTTESSVDSYITLLQLGCRYTF